MYNDAGEFYRSTEWQEFRKCIIFERTNEKGEVICEECGKPIIKQFDCIAHHIKEIDSENLNDCNVTLNPDNIQLLHARCHNMRHSRFGFGNLRRVFIVYGSPLSGKNTYVSNCATASDLVVDIDKIYQCISNSPMYVKSNRLTDNVFAVRQTLLDNIKYKYGKWQNAYVIGGFPYNGERERLAQELGAELIYIDCTKEEALSRLECCTDNRDKKEWKQYIEQWYSRYSE